MNVCRLCLSKGNDKEVLSVWDGQVEDLPNKIWLCVSIKIKRNDNLPTTTCLSCIRQVTQWITFKQICDNSNRLLLNHFSEKRASTEILDKLVCSKNETETCLQNSKRDFNEETSDHDEEEEDYFNNFLPEMRCSLGVNYVDYECDICKCKFDTCTDYLDHQFKHNGKSVFQCDKCSEVFDTREKIVEHDRNHRNSCPYCGKMILKSSMKLHLIKHTDKHMCGQCSNRFNSKASLAQHVITVHTDIKNYTCDVCGKKFSSQTALRVHKRSHSDERLYRCKLCSYAGRTASALYVHMSTHANDLCVCEVCSKTFKSNRNLNDHLRRVHNKLKKHECNYCGKKFVDRYMLSVHLRCHTGVRPYKCTICEKTFVRSDGLKEHIATHGQRTLHRCDKCLKNFTSKKGISRHNCKL